MAYKLRDDFEIDEHVFLKVTVDGDKTISRWKAEAPKRNSGFMRLANIGYELDKWNLYDEQVLESPSYTLDNSPPPVTCAVKNSKVKKSSETHKVWFLVFKVCPPAPPSSRKNSKVKRSSKTHKVWILVFRFARRAHP